MVPGSPLHSAGFAILLGVSSWHLAVTPAASSTDERTRGSTRVRVPVSFANHTALPASEQNIILGDA